jgi:aspartyl aminopeptidase
MSADPGSVDDLLAYLAASPSPFHAAVNAAARLDKAGFVRLAEADSWADAPAAAYVVRGGALVAWRRPDGLPAHAPFRLAGAHTDSPNLRVKPRPDTGNAGWRQLGVEVYGGTLLNSWLDRDLGLSGRVVLRDGSTRLLLVDRPVARVAQLAIHLDRDVNDKGLQLDRQAHLAPLWGLGTPRPGDLARFVAEALDLAEDEIAAWDLMFHDVTPPALLGRDSELITSGRVDNLVSCWAAIEALCACDEAGEATAVVALFDHEEVGSESTTGAGGPLVEAIVERIVAGAGGGTEDRLRAMAASACVSADMAHAVHPNYPERHEPEHRPLPNQGPVLKVNANQRYATDAVTAGRFREACDSAGVPCQVFVSRNNVPCGSTIGPITATRMGVATVDVGCAQLSMHSARELCGADDPGLLARALAAFFAR